MSSTKADIEDLRRIKPHEGKSSSEEPTNKQYLVDVSFVWLPKQTELCAVCITGLAE